MCRGWYFDQTVCPVLVTIGLDISTGTGGSTAPRNTSLDHEDYCMEL
jgi:hypothetical protein